jgi:hypothetical protein
VGGVKHKSHDGPQQATVLLRPSDGSSPCLSQTTYVRHLRPDENPSVADIHHNSVTKRNSLAAGLLAIFNFQNGFHLKAFPFIEICLLAARLLLRLPSGALN